MKRLVYSPYVQAFVKADDGVVDISPYIVRGSINRKVNQVSSAQLTLRNPVQGSSSRLLFTEYMGNSQQEPHPMFHPMDPIIIVMQRLQGHPVQVFTGYLDSAPYIQLYPGLCSLQASCTLKRLLYTQWDASLPAVQNFLEQFGWIPNGSGIWNPSAETGRVLGRDGKVIKGQFNDGSIGALLFAILNIIGDWDESTIWIEALPPQIKQIVVKLYNQITPEVQQGEAQFESLLQQVLGSGSYGAANPNGAPSNGTLDGNYTIKGQKPTATQAALVKQVMDVATGLSAPRLAVQALLEACIQENDFTNNPGGDSTSSGILQLLSSTAAGLGISQLDVNACVNAFLTKGFTGKGGAIALANANPNATPDVIAQDVQGSAFPTAYAQWASEANAIISSYRSSASTNGNQNGTAQAAPGLSPLQAAAEAVNAGKVQKAGTSPGGKKGNANTAGNAATSGNLANVAAVATAALQRQDQFHCFHYSKRRPIQYDLTQGTVYIDCSGFALACYKAAGLPDPSGNSYNGSGFTGDMIPNCTKVDASNALPGDLCFFGGGESSTTHVNVYVGNGQSISMGSEGEPKIGPSAVMGPSGFLGYYRSNSAGQAAATATAAGAGGNSMAAAFSTMLELPSIFSMAEAELFTGKRSFIADQPLFPFITQLAAASMRNFMSMPNGNFFAFFPDYFGFFGRKYYWEIRDIEIIDGRIDLSDDPLLTHMGVAGDVTTYSGEVTFTDLLLTAGIFDIFDAFTTGYIGQGQTDLPGFNQTHPAYGVINANPVETERTKEAAVNFLQRYGARPYVEEVPAIRSPFYELFLAFQNFMIAWSKQFQTTFELTFMPELFPGGLVALPDHHLQLYVEEVVHNFDYQQGFTTTVNVSSPSRLDNNSRQNLTAGLARPAALKAFKKAAETLSKGKTQQLTHRGP